MACLNIALESAHTDQPSSVQQKIKLIQRAYNNCPNPSLRGKSPNYILFGIEDRLLAQKNNIPPIEEDDEEDQKI